jgi:hypothetical protein
VALAGRVLQPPLARSTLARRWSWSTAAPSRLGGVQHRAVPGYHPSSRGQADPFDEVRLRLFSHGVESVSCPPSVSGAQSSSGWEGRKLPRRRRAGVPTRLRHPGPLPPGPRPGPQSLPMPDSLSLKGLTPPGSAGNATPASGKDSCAISAGTGPMRVVPGPGRARTRMQPAPSTVARLWAKELMAHLWTPVEPGLPPAHQLPKEPKAPAVLPASSCPAPPAHGCRPAAGAGSPGSSAGYRR